ncbi:MAG: hypothetical protein CMM26_02820 [Rhodospirillaceae bacterium]|nr:hypothetical protein [Rhodospirillaceae bacterium]
MHLMVIVEDRISEWVSKGEILDGYFNPSAAFETVTVFGLVGDRPDDTVLARLCAPAQHRYIGAGIDRRRLMIATGGLQPGLLMRALRRLMLLIPPDQPAVVRAYGDGLAAAAAAAIGRDTAIPFAVSVHTTADQDIEARYLGLRDRLWRRLLRPSVHQAMIEANVILAAYTPILDHLPDEVFDKALVVPNVVGVASRPVIRARPNGPMRALWLGRQMPGRDPRPIISALEITPNVTLTLIGDGPLHELARRAASGLGERVRFVRAMANDSLCASLIDYDVLVVNSGFREVPKTVMEAALSGLPVIINRLPAADSAEYSELPVVFADATTRGFAGALRDLESNASKHKVLAHETQDVAWRLWDPATVAARAAEVLREVAGDPGRNFDY